MSLKALQALRFVKEAFLNDDRWDDTDIGEAVNEGIEELENLEPVGYFAKFSNGQWREVTPTSKGVYLYELPYQKGQTD